MPYGAHGLPYGVPAPHRADGGGTGNVSENHMAEKLFSNMPDYIKQGFGSFTGHGKPLSQNISMAMPSSSPVAIAGSLPYSTRANGGRLGYYDGGDTTASGAELKSGNGTGNGSSSSSTAANTASQISSATDRAQPASSYDSSDHEGNNGMSSNVSFDNDSNNDRYSQRPQARPSDLSPAQADHYTGLWDMINGGGKGAGYKNAWDMINGGGMNAGYTGLGDMINGGGMGGSYAHPNVGGGVAPAPIISVPQAGTAAPAATPNTGSWMSRHPGLVGAGLGMAFGVGPFVGAAAGNLFKKDDQGNSKITNIFGKADGGAASGVPIVAAGGEYVIPPEDVVHIGGGDLDHGHKVLDAFVKKMRQKTIKTLQNLPGPKKD
jgi:hypothetical protein